MENVFAITNQKGGVGKTTTAVNLAASIASCGHPTLLIDLDPQGNATSGVGIDRRYLQTSVYDVLIGEEKVEDATIKTDFKFLSLLPSNISLAGAELELIDLEHREARLKLALASAKKNYEYIFIDCPPSLGLITTNALCMSDGIIVPMQCEYYALEGLSQLMNTVRRIKRQYNEELDLFGVVMTMCDMRLNLTGQVISEVKKYFPGKVFETTVPRGVRLSEAPSFGKPVMYFDKNCKGAKSYMALSKEIMDKVKERG